MIWCLRSIRSLFRNLNKDYTIAPSLEHIKASVAFYTIGLAGASPASIATGIAYSAWQPKCPGFADRA
jgi:hypothetical protein